MSDLVQRAREFATLAHQGQRRLSGAPFIVHPANTARLVQEAGGDEVAEAAAWLHDVVEDCGVPLAVVASMFGDTVARVVSSVTKPSLEEARRTGFTSSEEAHVVAVLLGSLQDRRVGLIKVADRLDNVRDPHPIATKRIRLARQTLGVHVLLAEALGLDVLARELSTLAQAQLAEGMGGFAPAFGQSLPQTTPC